MKVRAKKVSKKKASKKVVKKSSKKTAKKAAKKAGSRPVGKKTGLPVTQCWVKVFTDNEKASKAKKMTDDQISKFMHAEFPGRGSKVFDRVQAVRTKFNHGGLTQGTKPTVQSKRYDEKGAVLEVKSGRSGKKKVAGKKASKKKSAKKK